MASNMVQERIAALRAAMKQEGIQYYLIPTSDSHNSEYVNEHFKVRAYFSGFTGSSGSLLVGEHEAGLWTDGRYYIQAERELEGSGITLFRAGEEGVPSIEDYLKEQVKQEDTLGFNGLVVSAAYGKTLEEKLADKEVKFKYEVTLAENLWEGRPTLKFGDVRIFNDEISGRSVADKLADVRKVMEEEGTDSHFLSKLDDVMWLFNIRGCDVPCNPVAFSYAYITKTSAWLFTGTDTWTDAFVADCKAKDILLKDYTKVIEILKETTIEGSVLCDCQNLSYCIHQILKDKTKVVDKKNPTIQLKAIKNETEIKNMREVYLQDSLALTRFIHWIKTHPQVDSLNEKEVTDKVDFIRSQAPGYFDRSFETICGYGPNAAMMHYAATKENAAQLKAEGMLLVDSGGQYVGGTTDVTRTIALGPVADSVKKEYSAVTSGLLQLSGAKFLYGCTGRNLDILARQPLWDMGIDYKCGTGHGIGYMLNVHEGPQGVFWKYTQGGTEAVLEDGMLLSNEPGVYKEGQYGIRIENIILCKKATKESDGQFMEFESLTLVPIDLDLVDAKYMTEANKLRLNEYHQFVYEKLSPLMNEEERTWLKESTKAII